MRVGLFGPSFHHALLPPLATIATEAADHVTVFTTTENADHMMAAVGDAVADACTWMVKAEDESFRSFFDQVERATADLDVIWMITPYGPLAVRQELLTFAPRCPSITHLHASSRFVLPERPWLSDLLAKAVGSVGRYLPVPVGGRIWKYANGYLAPQIIRNYDCLLPLYPPIVEYVEREVAAGHLVDWFLPEFYRPDATTDHDGPQITIPGRVTDSLRDYGLLFDLLERVDGARDGVTVCILGRPVDASGERVMRRCEHYIEQGYDIDYYPSGEWIPAAEFARQLSRTDMLFAPDNIRGAGGAGRQNSIRGRTKTSGVVGDAVRIGRPLMMPAEFPVPPEFEGLITTYEDRADAIARVESWLASEDARRNAWQRAKHAAKQFSLEQQAERFAHLCQHSITHSS